MASFVTTNNKTKVIVRKKGYPTRCKTFLKKSDGIIWARKVESEMERGLFEDTAKAKKTLLSDVLNKYYNSCVSRNLKALSFIRAHISIINRRLKDITVIDVNSQCLSNYRNYRLTNASPATTKLELGIILRALKYAKNELGIHIPSFPNVKYPIVSNARNRRVSDIELTQIKSNITNIEIKTIITLALETAMRRSEILHMQWQHLDWHNKTLTIPVTKTNESREIPLTPCAINTLMSLKSQDIGFIFKVKAGSVSQAFKRSCAKLKIEDLRFHDLRHEATTRLFELGLNVIEVGSITGHRDLKMLNRYTHLKASKLGTKLRKLQIPKSQ